MLRMPILAFTSSLDGKLTIPFISLAWLLTALFASLLLWRVRVLVRGAPSPWARLETVSYGVLMATILAGSVFMLLAAEPDVFEEDLAWSVGPHARQPLLPHRGPRAAVVAPGDR